MQIISGLADRENQPCFTSHLIFYPIVYLPDETFAIFVFVATVAPRARHCHYPRQMHFALRPYTHLQ